jgi:predicted outer membrane repeat protein
MKTWLFLMGVLGALLAVPVGAEIIGVETFDYPDGNVSSQNGGVFWDYKNTAPAGRSGTASTWDVLNPTPTFNAGQLVTSGNAVAKREYNGFSESEGAISDANVANTVYYRVNVTTGPSVTAGDYFGISSVDGGTERLYFGKRGGSTTWGVEEVGVGGTNSIDSSDTILPNTNYTLVVHVDLPGNRIRLYVNPNLNEAQTSLFNNNNSLAANRVYDGTAASTGVRFAAGTAVRWDNLVVATTWEELQVTVVTTLADEDDGVSSLNTPSDISLREAVKYAPTGSLIIFAPGLSGRTITLTHVDGDMSIDRALTIDATALSGGLTVDGNGSTRHFDVTPTGSLTLSGMTLNRGNRAGGDGGSIDNRGTLRLHRCTFNDNVTDSGGAIHSIGEMEATQCTFSNNTAENGGGIYIEGGNAELKNCTLFGNQAFGVIEKRGPGDLGLFNCTIANNHAGGVIAIEGTVDMNFCTVSQNRGKGLGGGLFYRSPATVTLFGTVIAGNTDTSSSFVGPDVYQFNVAADLILTDKNFIGTLVNSGIAPGPDVLEGDPKLSALGDFGGPVQTMHPLIGSQLIDVIPPGDPEDASDARGFPGLVDGDTASAGAQYDLGAVEAGPLRTVAFSSDTGSSGTLRGRIGQSTERGARIGFFAANFPSRSITLEQGQLEIPATANGLFIDASNLSGPVTVSGNDASRVFNIASGATVAMHSVRIVDGQISGNGGGVLNAGKLMVMSSLVSGNGSSSSGGAICNDSGATCVVVGSTLTENAANFGGAISNDGFCTIIDSTLKDNTATSMGGGIYSSHTLNVRSSTFVENGANSGGGIRVNEGTCRVISSTFKGNSATFGGGINSATSSTCNVISSTLSGNAATNSGGGIVRFAGVLNVNSTIVTGNTPDNISSGHTGTNNIIGIDAELAPLGDYGGPTETMALLPGSPARNAGGVGGLSSDQRGFPIVGAPDVGAYEAQIGAINGVLLDEGTLEVTLDFMVGQVGTLSVISSSNPALVPVANIVLGGSGANRSVTLTPVVHQLGSSEVTLRDSLTGETQSFFITVNPDPTTVVTNTNDGGLGSLRQALIAAALIDGPNTITFAPGFIGPIVLGSELIINDSNPVAIDASSLPLGVGLDGNDGVRHFFVQAGSKLTLRVITLRAGFSLFDGGSIYSEGNLILERCFLLLNGSFASGGAIRSQGPFQAVDCTFSLNSASQAGGAVRYGGATELTRCTFSENTAQQQGGAIFHGSGLTATLTQCSLTGNEVPDSGTTGGIEAVSGTLNMVHCTIVGNEGGLAGGGLSVPSAAIVNITNCIIARNTRVGESMERIPADLFVDLLEADVNPMGANLIGSNDRVASLFPAGPLVGTPAAPLDPDLANLQNSGGFSPVMLPNPSSPAIDQASTLSPALTTDQRGAPRAMGLRPDLGAAESSIIIVTTPVDELDVPGVIGNGISLREAVRDVPLGGAIGFDRAVFNSPSGNQIILTEGPLNAQRSCYLDGTRNPGGILITYLVTILRQPELEDVAEGQTVDLTVEVKNLSGGVAFGWRKNGVFLRKTPGGALNLPNVTEGDEGLYEALVGDDI